MHWPIDGVEITEVLVKFKGIADCNGLAELNMLWW